jgi:hypothetical protein
MNRVSALLSIMALTGAGCVGPAEGGPRVAANWTHDPERLTKADEKRARKNAKRAQDAQKARQNYQLSARFLTTAHSLKQVVKDVERERGTVYDISA